MITSKTQFERTVEFYKARSAASRTGAKRQQYNVGGVAKRELGEDSVLLSFRESREPRGFLLVLFLCLQQLLCCVQLEQIIEPSHCFFSMCSATTFIAHRVRFSVLVTTG